MPKLEPSRPRQAIIRQDARGEAELQPLHLFEKMLPAAEAMHGVDILAAERASPGEREMKAIWPYLQNYRLPMEQPECRCQKREEDNGGQPGKNPI